MAYVPRNRPKKGTGKERSAGRVVRGAKPDARKRDARAKILEAATKIVREKGFAATSIDDLCKAAGVTKGAFFHHFASKDALGAAAGVNWDVTTSDLFAGAPYHAAEDPLERVLGYIDFRRAILQGEVSEFTCLAGTMVQEAYDVSPAIREACKDAIWNHAEKIEADITDAMERYEVRGVSAKSLALFTQVTLQGSFILSKAAGNAEPSVEALNHLRRYIELLFNRGGAAEKAA